MDPAGARLISNLYAKSQIHKRPEVAYILQRNRDVNGEAIPSKPADQLNQWYGIVHKALQLQGGDTDISSRRIENLYYMGGDTDILLQRIQNLYHRNHTIKKIPETYWASCQENARRLGGSIDLSDEAKAQERETIIKEQKSSLNVWLEHLGHSDYPMWSKHWVIEGVVKLSPLDQEKYQFPKRDKKLTVAPFPQLNEQALSLAIELMIKKVGKQEIPNLITNQELKTLLDEANFGKLYAYQLKQLSLIRATTDLQNTDGEWKTFPQGSDHLELVEALRAHDTGWCTAGETRAKEYLNAGDLHMYRSYDQNGQPTIPRIGICMLGTEKISEIRGILSKQAMEDSMFPALEEKLKELPDAEEYKKKVSDMKIMTAIEKKTLAKEDLTATELRFLYEIDEEIMGFGLNKDPRIEDIKAKRDYKKDLTQVFGEGVVAFKSSDFTEKTKAFCYEVPKGIDKNDGFQLAIHQKNDDKNAAVFEIVVSCNKIIDKIESDESLSVADLHLIYRTSGDDLFESLNLASLQISLLSRQLNARLAKIVKERDVIKDIAKINSAQPKTESGGFVPLTQQQYRILEKALVQSPISYLNLSPDDFIQRLRQIKEGEYEYHGDLVSESAIENNDVQKLFSLGNTFKVFGSLIFKRVPDSLPETLEVSEDLLDKTCGNLFENSIPDTLIVGGDFNASQEYYSKLERLPQRIELGSCLLDGNKTIKVLPGEGSIQRTLNIEGTGISTIPEGLELRRSLLLDQDNFKRILENDSDGSQLRRLNKLEKIIVYSDLDLKTFDFDRLPNNIEIPLGEDMDLTECSFDQFPLGVKVEDGSIYLSGAQVKDTKLPPLIVGEDLALDDSNFTELPDDLHVPGDLNLDGSAISQWPKGLRVDGDIYAGNTDLGDLPEDAVVGGTVFRD